MVLEFPPLNTIPTDFRELIVAFDPHARFESSLVRGKLFLTSHILVPHKDAPRVYMLHEGQPDGNIRLIETFSSRRDARRGLREYQRKEKQQAG